ncbi:MAG: hypothetical protein HYV07_32780 [Deltaproteobacteria bacterium]|nr:hypothetical protein [Deltaproteobacteria bacterium]
MKKIGYLVMAACTAMAGEAAAQVGIAASPHNLSNSTGVRVRHTSEDQICKFCHSPHKTSSPRVLWNRQDSTVATYSWGTDLDGSPVTATYAGTTLPGAQATVGGGSKRCLSCHDGSVALGDLKNAGGGVPGNLGAFTEVAVGSLDDATNTKLDRFNLNDATNGLQGNHPISVPFPRGIGSGLQYLNVDTGVAITDTVEQAQWASSTQTSCLSTTGYCTDGDPDTQATPTGRMINLAAPTEAGGAPGVECSSCHEPHNKYDRTGTELGMSGRGFFLRVTLNQSRLCRSCHTK